MNAENSQWVIEGEKKSPRNKGKMNKNVLVPVHMDLGIFVNHNVNFKTEDQRKDNSRFAR